MCLASLNDVPLLTQVLSLVYADQKFCHFVAPRHSILHLTACGIDYTGRKTI